MEYSIGDIVEAEIEKRTVSIYKEPYWKNVP